MKLNPSIIMSAVNSSTKSSKTIFQLVPFHRKQINVTQSFTGHGISSKCFH